MWILKDRVSSTASNMLIPVNLKSIEKMDAETLKREFRQL
jgi:hypothetical protein